MDKLFYYPAEWFVRRACAYAVSVETCAHLARDSPPSGIYDISDYILGIMALPNCLIAKSSISA